VNFLENQRDMPATFMRWMGCSRERKAGEDRHSQGLVSHLSESPLRIQATANSLNKPKSCSQRNALFAVRTDLLTHVTALFKKVSSNNDHESNSRLPMGKISLKKKRKT
jgi:hypothetical protein